MKKRREIGRRYHSSTNWGKKGNRFSDQQGLRRRNKGKKGIHFDFMIEEKGKGKKMPQERKTDPEQEKGDEGGSLYPGPRGGERGGEEECVAGHAD